MLEDRFARMGVFGGDWDDKPAVRLSALLNANVIINTEEQNDVFMWFANEAKGVERSLESLALRNHSYNLSCERHQSSYEEPLIVGTCKS
jgi:hypothetical protein